MLIPTFKFDIFHCFPELICNIWHFPLSLSFECNISLCFPDSCLTAPIISHFRFDIFHCFQHSKLTFATVFPTLNLHLIQSIIFNNHIRLFDMSLIYIDIFHFTPFLIINFQVAWFLFSLLLFIFSFHYLKVSLSSSIHLCVSHFQADISHCFPHPIWYLPLFPHSSWHLPFFPQSSWHLSFFPLSHCFPHLHWQLSLIVLTSRIVSQSQVSHLQMCCFPHFCLLSDFVSFDIFHCFHLNYSCLKRTYNFSWCIFVTVSLASHIWNLPLLCTM